MLAHDAARSGAPAAEIRPPFARKWYRLFPDEGLMSGVQPVVADGCVVVGTLAGVVHAIDAETGRDRWTFLAPGAVLHACAADGGMVFFGCADGKVYALRTSDGTLAWTVPTGAAVWNAPAVHAGTVLVGSRDGCLYAIDAEDGTLRWTAATDGPLLCSPAVDAKAGRVYVGSEDMHVYALALDDGRQIWRSAKLPGVSLRGYHPVVARDGSVLVTVTPAASLDRMASVLLEMVKEGFGDFASWRHSQEENARLREANFELLKKPETYRRQMEFLRRRLQDEPALQTFFVLDPATGRPWEIGLEAAGEFGSAGRRRVQLPPPPATGPARNTTIGVVATDAALTKAQALKVAQMAHDGLARAIRPAHTMFDGDSIFCLATCRRPLPDVSGFFPAPHAQAINDIGHTAADCTARAIVHAVLAATGLAGLPAFCELPDR